MKVPATPPDFRKEFIRLMTAAAGKGSKTLSDFAASVTLAQPVDPKGRYLHWEEIRFKPPAAGRSAIEEWTLIRRARDARGANTQFADKTGARFFFVKTDFMERALHEIDSQTRGGVRFDRQSPTRDEAQTFLLTSLIEEPFSSSVFEGAVATRDQAKKIIREQRAPRSDGERMIMNNYRAIEFIKTKTRETLTPAIICEVHRQITQDTLDDPQKAGVFRAGTDQIVVDDNEHEILHIPPPAGEIEERIKQLCRFANGGETGSAFVHPIIRAIILHFMLAYDHPFVDGNGRTARALFYWSVIKDGYWLLEYISISKQIKEAPVQYGKAFLETETDAGDLTYFIHNQLEMIQKAIKALYAFIDRKKQQVSALDRILSSSDFRRSFNYRQLDLLNRAARAPGLLFTIAQHRAATGVSYLTARADLEGLAEDGFLLKKKRGAMSIYAPARDIEKRLSGPTTWGGRT